MSLAGQVKLQLQSVPEGGVITSRALHKLSPDSQQVDKAASRLYKTAGLQKLRNGIYYRPYTSTFFGKLPPEEERIVRSIKQQYQAKVAPSGELAAYKLGLTDNLPDNISYETNKRIGSIQLENLTLFFRKVEGKKLASVNGDLLTVLRALEFLYKDEERLTVLQEQRIRRLLSRFSRGQLDKAIALWPVWFQDKVKAFMQGVEKPYITGLSALNIPHKGKQADWHQMGMLHRNKFQIAGKNYASAPNLHDTELFDCSAFLRKFNVDVGTTLCATPLRAMKDILFASIIRKSQYPGFFMLDQFMFDMAPREIKQAIDELRPLADEKQKQLLDTWMHDNELD